MAGFLNCFRQCFFRPTRRMEVLKTLAAGFRRGAYGLSRMLATTHLLWFLMELVVLIGIGYLLVIDRLVAQWPDGLQVMLLLAATGALLHALRRWLNSRGNPLIGTFSERLRGATWIAWLALAGAGWYAFLHPRLASWLASVSGKDGGSEPYLAAMGIVIAIVTAFYLLLLHRTADEGRRIIEELKQFQGELDQSRLAEKQLGDGLDFLKRDGVVLRKSVLQPMFTILHSLLAQAKLPTQASQPVLDKLQAQQSALQLLLTKTPTEFVGSWDGLQAYRKDLTEQVSYLSAKALRHFDLLLKDFPGELDEAEIRRLRRELRDWGRSSA